ncbi:branched-chain amino acid ABC transporter substrate-binding protein [Kaustia mangrovi]|uniref:Branched-chain amino acid ABC transporter substrate-binding protein n=1 Tax=Kaustia mangrovi TaxID=2593653 RepID=A0A7S8HBG2_9HYPH|nr:branched-chain amino acid ABC transporter substrate-binding protein [Kaustia mangrovi]QPC42466.1 branched-chain amino acid ABC transporter substrate-binding protein [Kaustia mangrovi]
MTVRKLGLALGLAAAAGLGAGAAQAEPLKIGIIESLSGSQTSTGRLFATAAEYVVDQINADGGFNGEPIEVIEYDNAGGTTGAADKFKQAVADGVHIVLQGASSAIAGQVTEDVRKHNIRNPGNELMYINLGAEALALTGEKCHFYQFRFTTTAPMRVNAMVDAMKEAGDLGTKVYSINQNYSWGRDMEDAIKAAADRGDYEVVDTVLHEVNKIQDFSPFVAKIKDAGPDTVMTGNWSNDLLLLMKAAGDAGLDVRFGTTFLDQVGNIANAGDTALGHYVAHPYNIAADDSDFAENYKAATGHYPVYIEPQTVNAIRTLGEALKTVDFGGGDVSVTEIAKAMENASIETPLGPITVRKDDHQAVLPVVVSKVVKDPKYPVDGTDLGFGVVKVVPGEDAIYEAQESCEMDRPS